MGTDFLYARPSFLGGMAVVLDLSGILVSEYNRSRTPRDADFRAISSDWAISGIDIQKAMEHFSIKNHVEKP